MARLLSQMNRVIELGNDIDLSLLLTWLRNVVFLPQDGTTNLNEYAFKAALASVSHVQQLQRMDERYDTLNRETTSLHNSNVSKMLEIPTLVNHPCWIAFSGPPTTLSPRFVASGSF
jgi:hypothetical protein